MNVCILLLLPGLQTPPNMQLQQACSDSIDEASSQVSTFSIAQELSLAGNQLTALPECIGKLTNLRKLQLSGNQLDALPDSLCNLTALEVRNSGNFAYVCKANAAWLNISTPSWSGCRVAGCNSDKM